MRRLFALAVIALHVLLLWLLIGGFRPQAEREPPQPQFVSIWLTPPTVAPATPAQPPAGREVAPIREPVKKPLVVSTPVAAPPEPITLPPTAPPPPPATTPQAAPPVDWTAQTTLAARTTVDALANKKDTFSPPPKAVRKPCKRKDSSLEMKGKQDRIVQMDGIVPVFRVGRHCVLALVLPVCALGALPEANDHLLDDMQKPDPAPSSVPDSDGCE